MLSRLRDSLIKTKGNLTDKVDRVLASFGKVDEGLFEELEEALITSDVGMRMTGSGIARLRAEVREGRIAKVEDVRQCLRSIIEGILSEGAAGLELASKPSVVLVIGVNGVGKTTFIGKLAKLLTGQGKTVLLAAGDTFRAAAIDQLAIWADRAGVGMVRHDEGSDPAAVIFDAMRACKSRMVDVLICDTAGRLHTKKNLMEELGKVGRVIEREMPEASKEVLLVLDATTGQNAVQQAKVFADKAAVTGIVLTKLDGTAKGGVALAVKEEMGIPIKFIGVGEGIEDLQPFDPAEFTAALFS